MAIGTQRDTIYFAVLGQLRLPFLLIHYVNCVRQWIGLPTHHAGQTLPAFVAYDQLLNARIKRHI